VIELIINISEQHYHVEVDVNDRNILTPADAFGLLREELLKDIGIERTKGFLIRYGWKMGVGNAKKAMASNLSLESLIKQGPVYHSKNGHISGSKYEGNIVLDAKQNVLSIYGFGTWNDSYEAIDHIKRFGLSKDQVCHTLVGYSSGYMSTICGHKVISREVACVAKGDSNCRWIVKSLKDWDHELGEELHFYSETPIIKELEYTYEQLIEQRNYIADLTSFQKRLTEEVSNGGDLQAIANLVYEGIHIPIVIEDIDFQTIAYSGLIDEKFMTLQADMQSYIQVNFSKNLLPENEKSQLTFRKKKNQNKNAGTSYYPHNCSKKSSRLLCTYL